MSEIPTLKDAQQMSNILDILGVTNVCVNIGNNGETYMSLDRVLHEVSIEDEEKPKTLLPVEYRITDNVSTFIWEDGTRTKVKRSNDDEHSARLAFLTAFFQKYSGMSRNKANKYLLSLFTTTNAKANKPYKPKHAKEELKVGDRVYHTVFGLGTIIKIDIGDLANLPYLVQFDKENIKRLHDGDGVGKDFHCYWCRENELIEEEE